MTSSKKIAILGHFGVGKTSLLRRFVDNEFSEEYFVTIGVQIKKKNVKLKNEKEISLIIWDLEGNTTIKKARTSYLLGTSAFIYVFDASRIETYQNINSEIEFLKEKFPKSIIKVVGNKSDLVKVDEIKASLNSNNIHSDLFTSAKNNDNVNELFCNLAEELFI